MLTTTLSDFRKDIKSYLDKVTQRFETLISIEEKTPE
jgi:antitoxin YefM